ncbi:hypothetical protein [Denitromonas ohlonensis]|uniref:DUF1833 domain-containing protein n=2 Tax=Denitromonas TaxID=139331 RepID=A0A557RRX1_9RHOO|nr:hypothetical protein [Denitromonas ohlonensis]TVO67862.1 hypothetical protein FHP90_04580 [Denitromonas ohlonensis]TVO78235.1 hypothetical protein FHP89_07085 [Denitromonas ohlonensis]
MATLDFHLVRKRIRIKSIETRFDTTISFEIRMPRRESLLTVAGEEVRQGYVEFTEENSKFPRPELHFIGAWLDSETKEQVRPSITFYADLPAQLFELIRDLDPAVEIRIRIFTQDVVGSIRYGDDPDGYVKIWDTTSENPVFPVSFELDVSYSSG